MFSELKTWLMTSVVKIQHQQWLLFAVFMCGLNFIFSVSFLSTQPYFDLEKHKNHIIAIHHQGERFILAPTDWVADPDHVGSFKELEHFLIRQDHFFQLLQHPYLTLELKEKTHITLISQTRTIAHLPFNFFLLQFYGISAFLIGIMIWIYNKQEPVTQLIALSGFGCFYYAKHLFCLHQQRTCIIKRHFRSFIAYQSPWRLSICYLLGFKLCYLPSTCSTSNKKKYCSLSWLPCFLFDCRYRFTYLA